MINFKLTIKATIALSALLVVSACTNEIEKYEKVKIIEHQGFNVTREMGINDKYDTTYSYKVINIKNNITFIYRTNDKFSVEDIIEVKL